MEGWREGGREGGRNINSGFQPLPVQVAISCFEYDSFWRQLLSRFWLHKIWLAPVRNQITFMIKLVGWIDSTVESTHWDSICWSRQIIRIFVMDDHTSPTRTEDLTLWTWIPASVKKLEVKSERTIFTVSSLQSVRTVITENISIIQW